MSLYAKGFNHVIVEDSQSPIFDTGFPPVAYESILVDVYGVNVVGKPLCAYMLYVCRCFCIESFEGGTLFFEL